MSEPVTSNKTIAKNTVFLYFRMMITMVVSLYTSRVILQVLGVDDYGIYQAVGGIVGFMGFLNAALATGSSRFLTFAMGEGDFEKLKRTFSTNVIIHLGLGLVVVLLAETVGLWFLNNKMVVPEERWYAVQWVYQLSILTAFLNITQVPYNAAIIAHERMSIYAYVSIVEVVLKLAIVYMLTVGDFDKLILYAILLTLLCAGLMAFYRWYCMRQFPESKMNFTFDRNLFKEVASFSGWSLFSNFVIALNSQGILVLLNMFFAPAVVAARAISLQVNNAALQFVDNFRLAANPQITKRYAMGDEEGSMRLLLQSTTFSYYLMFFLGLPICFVAEPLLKMWLGIVPEYAVIFLQLIIVQSLFQVFNTSLYQAFYAKGRIKENAILTPLMGCLRFPIIYLLFKMGYSPVALSWLSIINYMFLALVLKPILLVKICDYKLSDIVKMFVPCVNVTIVALILPTLFYYYKSELGLSENVQAILLLILSFASVALAIWLVGLDRTMKEKLLVVVKQKVLRRNP